MSDPKKKFVIKPFKPRNQMDNQAAQIIWSALSRAIAEIHNKNASALSFEELYRNAYNLVLHKHGELLYSGVKEAVQSHLTKMGEQVAHTTDEQLLQELGAKWGDHQVTMVMIRDILMYMDRTFVLQNKRTLVYDLGLMIFRDVIARHEQVRDRLQALLLSNVLDERNGQLIDRPLMKTTLHMLVDLGVDGTSVYEEDFEKAFLDTTRAFYQAESNLYISQNTCPDYMRKAEARLNEEAIRATQYLNSTTEPKLKHIVETELIENHAKTLVDMENSGCINMFEDDKVADLTRMFDLFSRVPRTLDYLRGCMGDHVKRVGRGLVQGQEGGKDPVAFVQGLLDLRDKYDRMVKGAFRDEIHSQKKLKEAFEEFINMDSQCAQYLAQYIDDLLKGALKNLSEDPQMDKVMVIFRYLQDKDVFESFYKSHLSKRLLSGRSVSEESEKNMMAKLKAECGCQYTSKMEGMFHDMAMSKDTRQAYVDWLADRRKPAGLELSVDMLTQANWPTSKAGQCRFPTEVHEACQQFEAFYNEKNNGRKISWQSHMGNVDLKAVFEGKRRHELNVSTYQMCILMLFNRATELSLQAIKAATNIPDDELKRHLLSLCTPKHRVLRKSGKGMYVEDDETFTFNDQFQSKLKRVRIPLVSMKHQGAVSDVAEALPTAVEDERKHQVDAGIVRIMKARKTLKHNDLIAEVTRQLSHRFMATPPLIKSRIENLIEREYLERDGNDRRSYKYLA